LGIEVLVGNNYLKGIFFIFNFVVPSFFNVF
jgi:hypothetical protein